MGGRRPIGGREGISSIWMEGEKLRVLHLRGSHANTALIDLSISLCGRNHVIPSKTNMQLHGWSRVKRHLWEAENSPQNAAGRSCD